MNPYAAVGAPVHMQHQWVQHGSPLREDTGGYFPPVPQEYFPFVPPSSSGLANEVMLDSQSSAGDTDVGVSGPVSVQPGDEEGRPILTETNVPRQESSDSVYVAQGSPALESDVQVSSSSLENLTMGTVRRAWTSDSKLGTPGESATKGRTQTSLPVELDGRSMLVTNNSSISLPHPVLRTGSDPVQTIGEVVSILSPTQDRGHGRRASFAEVGSEGNTLDILPKKAATITGSINVS